MMESLTSQESMLSESPGGRHPMDSLKPTTFHSFSKLPLEIQSLIWSLVEMEPRIIIEKAGGEGLYFAASYGPQAILHVSSQARAEGLRRFRPVLASGTGKETRYYHVDFSRDIFWLQQFLGEKTVGLEWGSGLYWTISDTEKMKLIRTVAIATYASNPFISSPFISNPFIPNSFISNPFVSNHGSNRASGPLESPMRRAWVDKMLVVLGPYLDADSALESVVIVVEASPREQHPGELGFASLEKESQWISDFKSYSSKLHPELQERLLGASKCEFDRLRDAEVLQEHWNVRMQNLGKKIGLRFVYKFFVAKHDNHNVLLAGDAPLRSRYYVPQ